MAITNFAIPAVVPASEPIPLVSATLATSASPAADPEIGLALPEPRAANESHRKKANTGPTIKLLLHLVHHWEAYCCPLPGTACKKKANGDKTTKIQIITIRITSMASIAATTTVAIKT